MNYIKLFFKDCLTLTSFSNIFIISFFIFIIRMTYKNNILNLKFDLYSFYSVFLSFCALYFFIKVFEKILLLLKSDLIKNLCFFLFLFLFYTLSYYQLRRGASLDFSVIADNIQSGTYKESLQVINSIFKLKDYIEFVIIFFILFILNYKGYILNIKEKSIGHIQSLINLFLYICMYIIIIFYTNGIIDPFSNFLISIHNRYNLFNSRHMDLKYVRELQKEYPLIRKIKNPKISPQDAPNIFIIMLESFNSNFLMKKSEEGKEYTPFLNNIKKNSYFIKNFYGNSIQTPKGMFATFCSVIPSIRGIVFKEFEKNNFYCLPRILKDNNYITLLFKAYHTLQFDNVDNFFKNRGFSHMYSMDESIINKNLSKKYRWGWGIQDNIFYKKTLNIVEKIKNSNPNKPIFANLVTVSHHQTFDRVPKNLRKIYPNPINKKQIFANSINVADSFLQTFFEEIKKKKFVENSVIFIMGDHSFPAGEHKNHSNERGFYEENFKTSLFIYDFRKKIKPKVVNEVYSQLNIAPTILNLAGISVTTHFMYNSIWKDPPLFTPLVQPYNGRFLILLDKEKMKYVYHQQSRKEWLFNLKKDPKEKKNIINTLNKKKIDVFRKEIGIFYFTFKLLQENRIWFKK